MRDGTFACRSSGEFVERSSNRFYLVKIEAALHTSCDFNIPFQRPSFLLPTWPGSPGP
uniref:Uncharacterized protein n=1 Tax=mine drainage metagenome TaxID=410659 RepID=E6PP61_9ZZZZ